MISRSLRGDGTAICKPGEITVKGMYGFSRKLSQSLQSVYWYTRSHSVTCHPTQVNTPTLIFTTKNYTRFTYLSYYQFLYKYASSLTLKFSNVYFLYLARQFILLISFELNFFHWNSRQSYHKSAQIKKVCRS